MESESLHGYDKLGLEAVVLRERRSIFIGEHVVPIPRKPLKDLLNVRVHWDMSRFPGLRLRQINVIGFEIHLRPFQPELIELLSPPHAGFDCDNNLIPELRGNVGIKTSLLMMVEIALAAKRRLVFEFNRLHWITDNERRFLFREVIDYLIKKTAESGEVSVDRRVFQSTAGEIIMGLSDTGAINLGDGDVAEIRQEESPEEAFF